MSGYAEYLKADALLELQHPLSGCQDEELVFIVAHQAYELWFKLIVADLRATIRALELQKGRHALRLLRRIADVETIMLEQMILIENLDTLAFAEIRGSLGSASGAQSRQYSTIEQLSTNTLSAAREPEVRDAWSAFSGYLERAGFAFPRDASQCSETRRAATLVDIYRQSRGDGPAVAEAVMVRDIAEALLSHDQRFSLWRYRHVLAASRHLGSCPGTGGTSGVEWLERRSMGRRFYPELWKIRTGLGVPLSAGRAPRLDLVAQALSET
jgi:tryptophan 2,3-dioxygenase